jgi:DNA polymerase-3 subunit gamma/tau
VAAAATRNHPLVKAAFDAFPQAELIDDGGAAPQRREIPWSRNA